ncbi:hypothetical protein MRX96_055915 [Rhipicephalus microplus]
MSKRRSDPRSVRLLSLAAARANFLKHRIDPLAPRVRIDGGRALPAADGDPPHPSSPAAPCNAPSAASAGVPGATDSRSQSWAGEAAAECPFRHSSANEDAPRLSWSQHRRYSSTMRTLREDAHSVCSGVH